MGSSLDNIYSGYTKLIILKMMWYVYIFGVYKYCNIVL